MNNFDLLSLSKINTFDLCQIFDETPIYKFNRIVKIKKNMSTFGGMILQFLLYFFGLILEIVLAYYLNVIFMLLLSIFYC